MENCLESKCKEILNDLVDTEDCDVAVDQLRSLESEGMITEQEYDYIMENWDELLK